MDTSIRFVSKYDESLGEGFPRIIPNSCAGDEIKMRFTVARSKYIWRDLVFAICSNLTHNKSRSYSSFIFNKNLITYA